MPRTWGLLPADIRQRVLTREWHKQTRLKARLLGDKPFPIRIGLKPPVGRSAIQDLSHFQRFIGEWRSYSAQHFIEWESRSYRQLSVQEVPTFFVLNSIQELIECVGDEAIQRSHIWEKNMSPLLVIHAEIYPVLVKHLAVIESMRLLDAQLLADLIGQLAPNMGAGLYLRALPLVGVDTKFLESFQSLLTDILDVIHDNAVASAGGLIDWLGCHQNPKGWLSIRPLCESVKIRTGGFPVLQLSTDILKQQELPADNILVVENMQSGLGLPELHNTIAVFGGGKNVAWMDAEWLQNKHVGYWGDIDTWGLSILSDARSKLSSLEVLMMDKETLNLHEDRMVGERKSVERTPEFLTPSETQLFLDLIAGNYCDARLEQERLSPDYVRSKLDNWVN